MTSRRASDEFNARIAEEMSVFSKSIKVNPPPSACTCKPAPLADPRIISRFEGLLQFADALLGCPAQALN